MSFRPFSVEAIDSSVCCLRSEEPPGDSWPIALTSTGAALAACSVVLVSGLGWWAFLTGFGSGCERGGICGVGAGGTVAAEAGSSVGVGVGGFVGLSTMGGASGRFFAWSLLCTHPASSNSSSNATLFAGVLILQTLPNFPYSPAEDAGVPIPWRRAESASRTPYHGFHYSELRRCHGATAECGTSWRGRCRCPRSWS